MYLLYLNFRHAQEAAKCHDFDIGTDSFSCPTGYADNIRQIADIFVKTTYDVYCGGDGNPMISSKIHMFTSHALFN